MTARPFQRHAAKGLSPARTRLSPVKTGPIPVKTGLSPVRRALRQTATLLCAAAATLLLAVLPAHASPGDLLVVHDTATGGLRQLRIAGDVEQMPWLVATDGSQYAWIGPEWQ